MTDDFNALTVFSHFWATVCKTVHSMLSVCCPVLSVCPVCDVRAPWPNSWTDQDEFSDISVLILTG